MEKEMESHLPILRTVVKKGKEMESHLPFAVAACKCCEEGSSGNGTGKLCLVAKMSRVPALGSIKLNEKNKMN